MLVKNNRISLLATIGPVAHPATRLTPAVTPATSKVHPRIGLALGGGAARGFAHVGVIQVLEEAGIRPALVVGTSAGSLVAALYASGKTGAQLQQLAETMEEASFADWMLPVFSRGASASPRWFDHLPHGVLFQRGDTAAAVRASSAVPAVFQPVRISGRDYVDGGLVSPVPVRYARQMGAELVIAVDISSPPEGNTASDTLQVLLQTFSIMSKSINYLELRDADLVVRPPLVGVGSADFSARRRAIDAGRRTMLELLPQLKAAIDAKTR